MTQQAKRKRWLLAAGIVMGVIFGSGTVLTYPPPTCDEATYTSNADALLSRGDFGLTILTQPDPFGRDSNMVHMGRLAALLQAPIYMVFGVNWNAARIYTLIGWMLATILTYILGMRMHGTQVGVAAAALFATSIRSFFSGHMARPDIWTAAAVVVALLALLELLQRPRRFPLAFAVGVFAVVPFDFHANGMWFLLGFCSAAFLEFAVFGRDWQNLFGYALGVVSGLCIWLAAHLLPAPAQSWYQLTVGYRLLGNLPLSSGLLSNAWGTLSWLYDTFWTLGGPMAFLELCIGIFGIIFAVRRRTQHERVLLVVLAASAISFALIMSQKFVQYGILWLPLLLVVGMAALREWIAGHRWPFAKYPVSAPTLYAGVVFGLLTLNLAGSLWLVYRFRDNHWSEIQDRIDRSVPRGTRVMASPIWWWSLRSDRVFLSDEYATVSLIVARNLNGDVNRTDKQIVESAMNDLRPDYILLDDAIGCNSGPDVAWNALATYAASNCDLIAAIPGPWVDDSGKQFSVLGQTTRIFKCTARDAGSSR